MIISLLLKKKTLSFTFFLRSYLKLYSSVTSPQLTSHLNTLCEEEGRFSEDMTQQIFSDYEIATNQWARKEGVNVAENIPEDAQVSSSYSSHKKFLLN